MSNKKTVWMAAGLSTFALIVIGGITSSLLGWTATMQGSTAQPVSIAMPQETSATESNLTTSPTFNLANISPQNAGEIAKKVASKSTITKTPELVDYNGTVAYEVTLNHGLVYIDANKGSVLGQSFNSQKAMMPQNTYNNNSSAIRSTPNAQPATVEAKADTENDIAVLEEAKYASRAENEYTRRDKHRKHERENDDDDENEEKHDG